MSDYKLIKLLTGEELLAEVTTVNEVIGYVVLKNPVRIIMMPNRVDPKTPSVGFAPWLEFAEENTVKVDSDHIVAILTPIKQFVEQYRSMFSAIAIPNSGLIIPGA